MNQDPFKFLLLRRACFRYPAENYMEEDPDYNARFKHNPAITIARQVNGTHR